MFYGMKGLYKAGKLGVRRKWWHLLKNDSIDGVDEEESVRAIVGYAGKPETASYRWSIEKPQKKIYTKSALPYLSIEGYTVTVDDMEKEKKRLSKELKRAKARIRYEKG